MIEVSRALYMDERTGDRLLDFASVAETIRGAAEEIIDNVR